MKNVLITTSSFADQNPGLLNRLQSFGLEVILNPFQRRLTEDEVANLIEEHRPIGMIAGVEFLTRKVLMKQCFPKVISRCGIGMDSVDLEAAKEFGITVTNTPDAPTVAVAELTLGLILSLLRNIPSVDAGIRRGDWLRPMGQLLFGKTVGIVGCGRIGTRLAKSLSNFGCRVIGYDPHVKLCEFIEIVPLQELLREADIISLHLPYTSDNHHFLNDKRLLEMKEGAFLVNAARGGLVDECALLECLKKKKMAGAALDCFGQEPYCGPLASMDNVVLTCHLGSYAKEARIIMEEQSVENLLRELTKLGIV